MSKDTNDNYVCTLDQASIKRAKDELNEVPEDRLAAVQALREWIQAQPHIRCPKTDTHFLLRFLRWSKFSQIRAREKLEDYLSMRVTLPKTFPDLDPKEKNYIEIVKAGYCFPLPERDSEGRVIIMCRLENLAKLMKKFSYPILYRSITIMMEYLQKSENFQVNGSIFFADFSGFTASIMTKMLTQENGNITKMWLKSNPGRFKQIHYYNVGVLFEGFIGFIKMFMPKKLVDRIKTHDTMESVYKFIPKDLLPEEYLPDDYTGKNAGSMNTIIDNFLAAASEKDVREEMMYRSSKAFGVDLDKKPTESVTQHFRKLNVD